MSHSKHSSLVIVIFTVVVIIISGIFIRNSLYSSQFAQPVGILHTNNSGILESHINTFMESHVSQYDLGKDNYHCSNIVYGYDAAYAYAWVYCSGFIITTKNEVKQGTAFSIPTRLAYTSPNFHIVSYLQPRDGSLYSSSLQKLFPKQLYDEATNHSPNTTPEGKNLEQEVRSKVSVK